MQATVEAEPNLFTPFSSATADEQPSYAAAEDEGGLRTLLTSKLAEYNETHVGMDLVLFQQVYPS